MKTRVSFVALPTLLLVLLAGLCLSGAARAQKPLTLRLWGGSGGSVPRKDDAAPWNRAARAVMEEFQHRHPEIKLEVATGIEVEGPANESGLLMAIAGGLAPDVVYVNFRQLENYVDQGFLYPLDEFIAAETARGNDVMAKIHKGIRDVITVDGHVYSFPWQQAAQALYYRKDLFREAGLDPDRPPRDWDEFYAYAQKLTDPDKGQWGFGFEADPQGTAYWWVNFLWQAGGEVLKKTPEGRYACAFNTPEGAKALAFYRKLVAEEWTLPSGKRQRGVAIRTKNLLSDLGAKGKLAMWFQYQTDVVANRATASISPSLLGIAAMPVGPSGRSANEINAYMFGISAQQKDPRVRQAAWEFIKFLGSDEADAIRTKAYVEAGLGSSVNPTTLKKFGYDEFVTATNLSYSQSLATLFENGKPEPHGKNCQMIYSELDTPLEEIGLYPDRDPLDVLNRAAAKIDKSLLGYVPDDVMKTRRTYALGAVTLGFVLILGGVTYMLRRLSMGVAGDPGSRPAGMSSWRYHVTPWLYMAPAVLTIAIWAYFPLARGLVMAFQDYKIAEPPRWIGLDNFIDAATKPLFWQSILHAFQYVLLTLSIGFFLPIILALMLSEVPRGRILFRTLYYLPAVTSGLVILFLWKQFYDPSPQGLFNQLLSQGAGLWNGFAGLLHLPWRAATEVKIDWLGNPSTAMLAVVLPGVWAGAGPGSIIYLAALKTISDEQYEAADLDGAGIWMKIRTITLPSLKPLIIINLVGAFIGAFKAMENIFVMTGGGPLYSTHTIGLEVWYNAFMYLKFGYATAAAWIMGAMLVGFTLYQLRILRDVRFSAGG